MPLVWPLEELKGKNISYSQSFQLQDNIRKIYAHDLRRQSVRHPRIALLMVYSEAFAVCNSSRPACSLISTAFAAWNHHHFIDASLPIKSLYFDVAGIDDVSDIGNGD